MKGDVEAGSSRDAAETDGRAVGELPFEPQALDPTTTAIQAAQTANDCETVLESVDTVAIDGFRAQRALTSQARMGKEYSSKCRVRSNITLRKTMA